MKNMEINSLKDKLEEVSNAVEDLQAEFKLNDFKEIRELNSRFDVAVDELNDLYYELEELKDNEDDSADVSYERSQLW